MVGTTALPRELLARLAESTGGNPLFVRELMRMLVDDQVIVEGEHGWELAIDEEAVEVPPTVQSLLSTRIERLPGNERRMLERASVVGADFPLAAVAALTPGSDPGRLIPVLERLRRKELVEATDTYWGNEPVYRFHHALIRDAAYRRLLKRTRADHHVTVADWIEGAGGTVAGEHDVAIGYHLEQAHGLRVELDLTDATTAEIGVRAAEALGAAARRSLGSDDVATAGSLAARAVGLLDEDAPDLSELLVLGCEAFFASGDVSAALPLLTRLEGRTDDDGSASAWAAAFRAQLRTLTEPDRLVDAEATAARAAESLGDLGDHSGEAHARLVRASALARLGHIGACEAELDRALTAARAAADGRRVATILGAAPVAALWGPSSVPLASGRCLDVLRLLRITTGSPRVGAVVVRCQAVLEALRGRFDTARDLLADSRSTVEELGDRHGLLETRLYSGIVELLANEPGAAEPHLRAAHGGLGRLGIGADAGQAAAYLSRALLLQGRLDEAAVLAADSEALAGQNPQTVIASKTACADLLTALGELDEAHQVATDAVAAAEGTDIVIDHANANLALARVRSAAGDVDGASSAADAARRLFTAKGVSLDHDVAVPSRNAGPVAGRPAVGPVSEHTNAAVEAGLRARARHGTAPAPPSTLVATEPHRAEALVGWTHQRVLAMRDERLALIEECRSDDLRERRFSLIEVDEQQRICEVQSFDWNVDGLTEATDVVDDRWSATAELDEIDVLMMEAVKAWRHGDQASLDRILHQDFRVVDHRSLSWGEYDRNSFIALFDGEASNVVVEVPAVYLGGSGSGRAFQLTAWGFSEDEMIEALHGHFVAVFRAGRLLRCDGHDVETPDEALVHLRELQHRLGVDTEQA